jgi:hypothetical protein
LGKDARVAIYNPALSPPLVTRETELSLVHEQVVNCETVVQKKKIYVETANQWLVFGGGDVLKLQNKLRGLYSASELYRLSYRLPTSVDRGVSCGERDGKPTVVNLSFLDRSRYFSFM